MSYLSKVGAAARYAAMRALGRREFNFGHLDAFAEDFEYMFANARRALAAAYRWGGPEDVVSMSKILKYIQRGERIRRGLEEKVGGMDVGSYDPDLRRDIEYDLETVREMHEACMKELGGEVYESGSVSRRRSGVAAVRDALWHMKHALVGARALR